LQSLICDICGGNDWKSIYEKQALHPLWWVNANSIDARLRYVVCQKCGYITLFPRLGFDEYETYCKLAPAPSRAAFSKRSNTLEARKTFILDHIGRTEFDVLIEVGPAYGDFLLLLSEFKKRIGVEPASKYCEFVETSKLPLEYHCCMLERVPEHSPDLLSSADLALAANVLEHAFEPRTFLRNLINLAKPGGNVYIEVPCVEAMAEAKHADYQTLHFGHISQFSADVLTQLCISESLEPVSMEVSSKDKYPVMRGLYKKPGRADRVAKLFQQHVESIDHQAQTAKKILVRHLVPEELNRLVVWGCGTDLLDVLNLLDDSQRGSLAARANLVDTNDRKHHRKMAGMEILDPTTLSSEPVDTVLISSRSELIQSDIMKDCKRVFPKAEVVLLFPFESKEEENIQ